MRDVFGWVGDGVMGCREMKKKMKKNAVPRDVLEQRLDEMIGGSRSMMKRGKKKKKKKLEKRNIEDRSPLPLTTKPNL